MTTRSSLRPLVAAVAIAASTAACCHRKARHVQDPAPFQPAAVVKLECPSEAPSRGPLPIEVVLDADARTYWDNQGVLDQALHVFLVRRDRPGVLAIAKVDPSALMAPPAPLPGRPSDSALARDRARIVEHKHYDVLAYGRQHPGAASYFVLATFADAWAGPAPLTVTDPAGPLAPSLDAAGLPPADEPPSPSIPGSPGVVARLAEHAGKPAIVGGFRTADGATGAAVLTLVLGHLRPAGGALVRQLELVSRPEKGERVGGFAVPLSALDRPNPSPPIGRHVLFAFVGPEAAPPAVIEIR